jgi:RNA polymerase sigma factor (sigma-70 family)
MVVRYCMRLTGDPEAAEDLAQQALLEAWLKSSQLYQDAVRDAWLLGMARNVCLRWMRARAAATRRVVHLTAPVASAGAGPADAFDLEAELERDELARLIDRAMALLPAETREVLVQKYIEESPQADVARRLGLTEGAVEARLHRGKLALRRVLTTDLRDDAVAYGLIASSDAGWQETRIWCASCGERRLIADQPVVRAMVWLAMLINVASFLGPLYPALVSQRLHGNAAALGMIEAAGVVGGMGGALAGVMERRLGAGHLLATGWGLAGACTLGMSVSLWLPMTAALVAAMVFGFTMGSVSMGALTQALIPDIYRGRVWGLTGSLAVISIPFSTLIGGWLADIMGVAPLFAGGGIWIVGVAAMAWFNKHVRTARI